MYKYFSLTKQDWLYDFNEAKNHKGLVLVYTGSKLFRFNPEPTDGNICRSEVVYSQLYDLLCGTLNEVTIQPIQMQTKRNRYCTVIECGKYEFVFGSEVEIRRIR